MPTSINLSPIPLSASDDQVEKAAELLEAFLQGMPELRVDSETQPIVDAAYGGDVRKYMLDSFHNFVDQVVDELELGGLSEKPERWVDPLLNPS